MKVTLSEPVTRGDETIATVEVREPKAGELRGAKIVDLLQMDVNALLTVLPRVTTPALMPAELSALPGADLTGLGSAVVYFLSPASVRAQVMKPE